jgi:tetratricopeptide (TPR) repeat protein
MRRCLIAAAFVLGFALAFILASAVGAAADDQAVCNDRGTHSPEIVAACDRAISSGRFGDAELATLYLSRAEYWSLEHSAEKAYADYDGALQIQPNELELLDRAFVSAVAAGKVDAASGLATRILARNKNYPVAHLVLGVQALKASNYADAQAHIRQSAKGPVTDLVATLLSAWTSHGAGESKVAIATIDKLNGAPGYAIFKDLHAGLIFELSGKDKEAGVRFARDVKLDDAMLRVTEAYAHWLSRSGDQDKAIGVYEAFDRKLAHHPLVQEGLRRLKAGDRLPPLVETAQAGGAEALYGIGAALTLGGSAELALTYIQLALYLQPNHALAQLALADAYDVVKAPQYAIPIYRRFVTTSPFWRHVQMRLAIDIDAAGDPDEAIRILRPIIADDPKDLDAILALGNIERSRRKYADCIQTYSKGIELLPAGNDKASSHWFYYRGICEERSRLWPRAEIDLRKALELQPDEPNMLNYLGYWLVDQGLKTEEAITLIRRAVQQKPNDGYVVDSLGWADYRMGNLSDAEKNLTRAVELKPDDPIIRRHMGDLFWRLGREGEARLEWTEARRLNPEPDESAEIERRLRSGLPDGAPQKPVAQTASADAAQPAFAVQTDTTASVAAKTVGPSGRRVALVIGNSGYRSVPMLANPRRDSRAMADVLRRVGFQSVTLVNDMTHDRMVEAIRAFASEADHADWAVIYYAGHGIEVGGLNYLIPVDARLLSDRDVQFEAIALDQIMAAVEGASRLRLVMLDACRDNPFADVMRRTTAMRSVGHGLGQVEPEAGMLVVFAAKHGQTVFDGDGQNSPFVSAFVKRVSTPQIEIRKLFDMVRDDVMTATRRQQQPFTYGSVSGSEDFYFLTSEVAGKVN